jgi:hypothetical protein
MHISIVSKRFIMVVVIVGQNVNVSHCIVRQLNHHMGVGVVQTGMISPIDCVQISALCTHVRTEATHLSSRPELSAR